LLPNWSWQTWLLLTLALLFIFSFEVVFRKYGKQHILNRLILEGEQLQPLLVQQGRPAPLNEADKWRFKVIQSLTRWFGASYADQWVEHADKGAPRQGFSGMAETNRIKLSAGLEWLRDFRMRQ